MTWNWNYGIILGLATLYGLWVGAGLYTNASVEKLSYEVVSKIQGKERKQIVELRQYPSYLTAEASYYSVDMKTAMNFGFHDIAGFIFGDNVAPDGSGPEKIAMTAPVIVQQTEQRGYTISFVMPSKYTRETLPTPNNKKVTIKEIQPQKLASISWKGNVPSEKLVQEKEEELRAILKLHGYHARGQAYLFEYDPPFTPGWMRLNEVLIAVEQIHQTD